MRKRLIKITSRHSGNISVKVPYIPSYIKRLKDIKGHRWVPEEKCWIFPQSENVVRKLLDLFKCENVWLDPSLRRGKEDINIFEYLRKEMVSRKYSSKTIKSYIHSKVYTNLVHISLLIKSIYEHYTDINKLREIGFFLKEVRVSHG